MPKDNGLTALGLIMQLGGGLWLGLMGFMVFTMVIIGGQVRMPGTGAITIICLLGLVRSGLHRSAGSSILYGSSTGQPLRASYVYIIAAFAHSALTLLIMKSKFHMPGAALTSFALVMLAWPATLLILLQSPRFSRFTEAIPRPSDRGYEGVGVLMLSLGIIGSIFTGVVLLMLVKAGNGKVLSSFEGMIILFAMLALMVRSIMHTRAGLTATKGTHPQDISHAAYKYTSWGFGAGIGAAAGVFLIFLTSNARGGQGAALGFICLLGYMLLIWPLILRRFFAERDFADILDDATPETPTRAPDLGMTALGFLLLALGVQALATALPAVIFGMKGMLSATGGRGMGAGGGELIGLFMRNDIASLTERSHWFSLLVSGVQIWAAIELITMSQRWKLAALVYGIGATVVTLYVAMPLFDKMSHLLGRGLGGGMAGVMVFAQVAIALVLPVLAIILANRHKLEPGQARVHMTPPPPSDYPQG